MTRCIDAQARFVKDEYGPRWKLLTATNVFEYFPPTHALFQIHLLAREARFLTQIAPTDFGRNIASKDCLQSIEESSSDRPIARSDRK